MATLLGRKIRELREFLLIIPPRHGFTFLDGLIRFLLRLGNCNPSLFRTDQFHVDVDETRKADDHPQRLRPHSPQHRQETSDATLAMQPVLDGLQGTRQTRRLQAGLHIGCRTQSSTQLLDDLYRHIRSEETTRSPKDAISSPLGPCRAL
ncbi:hypothetical protein RUM43_003113 [Polyplax serrata]|uniref:Uncharacterized protein n=1 Tax=Polyplax serrata TaxID=468196 RepID=A0AAN8P198_POLSC